MPKEQDIAWKFVIKLKGNKWRCPYCENEYSGQVTRVRSHLLKQPNKGIFPCKKVSEHISMLMGCLQNQGCNKDDIAWKFVNRLEDNKWLCHYCSEQFFGDLTRVKGHLLKVPNGGISICTKVPDHIRELMRSLLDEVAEEESREADCQFATEPQSRDLPTQAKEAEEESREANRQFAAEAPSPLFSPGLPECGEQLGSNQQDAIGLNSDQQSQAERQFHQSSTMPLSVQNSHVQPALVPLQHQSAPHQSVNHNTRNAQQNPTMHLDNLDTTQQPDLSDHRLGVAHGNEIASSLQPILMDSSALSPLDPIELPLLHQPTHLETGNESHNSRGLSQYDQVLGDESTTDSSDWSNLFGSLPESRDANVNTCEEIQMNELHNPTMGSSLQNDSSVDVDSMNRLPDCSQAGVAEVVPVLSNMSLTNTVQHPDQLHPRYDKECGNDARSFASQTPMDIDPSRASQHTTESHIIKATIVDSQVPEASTNTTVPSSSQDMNRVSPNMNVWSIYSNDEEIKNLKRKVEELYCKEALIKERMEIESGASSVRKKPRIVVQKWLNETERARNNFQMIGQANAEILPPTEKVETLMREVEELIEQTLPQTLLIKARDAKGNAFLERKLIGEEIHRNIELIWNRLKENNGCKLGIYGMGGVGKTTIMMHIHNRLRNDPTFGGVLFVTVSQDFSIFKLQSDIWKELKLGVMEDEHEKKRAAVLSECLERKKNCVLILDDVWRHFKLQDVGIPDKPGLKVVLTTRLSDVCSRMDCEEIKIQPLGEKEAWELFVEELGPQTLKNIQIEKAARKIANRCAGLPLAINAMARSMRGQKNIFVWQDTLNKLERSHTKHAEMGDEVLPVLTLSYERLSDPQVKQCFVFCALFPEDTLIPEGELIECFIDEGFLDELDTREEQYCRGLAIVDKLRNACLLEVHYYFFRMHDLMRDMALHIMNTTCMVKAGQGLRTIPNGERWTEDLEKVSLMRGRIEDIPPDMSPNCPKLSTLLLNGSLQSENVQLQHSFFMNLRGLKVLNLSECDITKLPDSLSELANLRALLLRKCQSLIRVPYLGRLKYLRKLDAMGCRALLAVEGLEELSNLRYLDLSETGVDVERSWEGTFSRMVNLQYLEIVGKVKAEEVIRLKALKRLECSFGNVDDFNNYVRFMECRRDHNYGLIVDQEKSLWFVTESVYSDPEISPENETENEMENERVSIYGDYRKSVEIRSCNYAMARVGGERNKDCIWIPGDVEIFKGKNCRGMTNLSGMSPFRDLEVLIIEEWVNLVELFGRAGVDAEEIDDTQDSPAPLFPSLETLKIQRCSKLKCLYGHESRFSLPLLCEGIGAMNSSVASPPQPEESGNMKRVGGSEWLPHFPSLKRIMVEDCDNIRELFPHECLLHLPNLEGIEIYNCEKLEEIIGGGALPSGVTCGRLIYLIVSGCNNMKRVLLMQDSLLHLPSLQGMSIRDCKSIEVIIGAVANTAHASFPKLTHLTLRNLPKLKSICDGDGTVSCYSLHLLGILKCPKLKRIPVQLPLLDNGNGNGLLPSPPHSLREIWIENRQTWESLEWDHPHASSSLQHLVQFCDPDSESESESYSESDGESEEG